MSEFGWFNESSCLVVCTRFFGVASRRELFIPPPPTECDGYINPNRKRLKRRWVTSLTFRAKSSIFISSMWERARRIPQNGSGVPICSEIRSPRISAITQGCSTSQLPKTKQVWDSNLASSIRWYNHVDPLLLSAARRETYDRNVLKKCLISVKIFHLQEKNK